MKTYKLFLVLSFFCFLIFASVANAQATYKPYYHSNTSSATSNARTSGYSKTGSNIDVVYHRAWWRINPDSSIKYIKGIVTTYFVTTSANVSAITFDLRQSAFNNSNLKVKYNGVYLSSTSYSISNSNVLSIALGTSLPINRLDSVEIEYGGIPPATTAGGVGYQKAVSSVSSQNYIYTLSESYEDRDWWPCKADMQDKIDSMDIIVSTRWTGADTFWVASNGKLVDSAIRGTNRIFTFKTRYPIASYLVSVAVARYNRYYSKVNVGGTDVQVAYYLLRGRTATNNNSIRNKMESINPLVVAFSDKFGDYPFKNEKHGFYEGLEHAGGMEHQTFSAIATGSITHTPTLIHELVHQWFGDKVTFATWNHLWLAEGMGRYSEALAGELVGLGINPVTARKTSKDQTISTYATTSLVIPTSSIDNSDEIWATAYGGAVYAKGAVVLSMLRKLAGDDKFFKAIRNYLNDPSLAYKSATTEDFKNHFEAVLNYDLDPFFDDFAYGTGHPTYTINWGKSGNRLNIQVTSQTRSTGSSVTYFRAPIVVKASNSSKDTTIVIYDQNGSLSAAGNGISKAVSGNVLAFDLSFSPTALSFDPVHETLALSSTGTGALTQMAALNTTIYAPVVLPISIIDFKGWTKENSNLLQLSIVTSEEKKFIILERGENGTTFYTLGDMREESKMATVTTYGYHDRNIQPGKTYVYRVKTIDEKGVVKYSKVIQLSNNQELRSGIKVSPNPASDFITVTLPMQRTSESLQIALINSIGVVVEKRTQDNVSNKVRLNVADLPAGTYQLRIERIGEEPVVKSITIAR